MNILYQFFPNTMDKTTEFFESILQTLQMTAAAGAVSFFLGLLFGLLLTLTGKGGLKENRPVYYVADKLINICRSIPFVIMLTALLPVTRAIMGSAIGTRGAIIPLIVGSTPFFARQVEAALAEIDRGLVEAALSMGDSPFDIVFKVYLREGVPAIARGVTITLISLVGLTAMAGAVAGGGLGSFAIMWGHQRHQTDCTYAAMIAILLIVFAIQWVGNLIIKKTTH